MERTLLGVLVAGAAASREVLMLASCDVLLDASAADTNADYELSGVPSQLGICLAPSG